jgi:hypothetical protein
MPPVERLEVEEAPIRQRLKSVPPPMPETLTPTPTPELVKTTDPKRLELMVKVIVQVLSLRAILLLAMAGAFTLAARAMSDQTPMALGVLGIYCLFAIVPVAYLEIRRNSESSA